MFWARIDSLKDFLSIPLKFEDFATEPISVDATLAHTLERIIFIMSSKIKGNIDYIHLMHLRIVHFMKNKLIFLKLLNIKISKFFLTIYPSFIPHQRMIFGMVKDLLNGIRFQRLILVY